MTEENSLKDLMGKYQISCKEKALIEIQIKNYIAKAIVDLINKIEPLKWEIHYDIIEPDDYRGEGEYESEILLYYYDQSIKLEDIEKVLEGTIFVINNSYEDFCSLVIGGLDDRDPGIPWNYILGEILYDIETNCWMYKVEVPKYYREYVEAELERLAGKGISIKNRRRMID